MLRLIDDFRRWVTFGVAQYSVAVFQVCVQFHESNCNQAIEPGIGHSLHGVLETMLFDAGFELISLLQDSTRMFPPSDNRHIAQFYDRLDLRGRESIKSSAIRHRLDEVT